MARIEEVLVNYVPKNQATTPNIPASAQAKIVNNKFNALKTSSTEPNSVELIKKYKEGIEANIVLCLYYKPELFLECHLTDEDFSYNYWRVYFIIAKDLYRADKSITEDNINFYLEQHPKLSQKYEEYGGYDTITRTSGIVNVEDFDSYVADIGKWNAILKLADRGFPIKDRLNEFADMTADDIYDEFTLFLNDAFITVDEKVKSYNAFDNLDILNEELDAGKEKGYDFMPEDKPGADGKPENEPNFWPKLKSPALLNQVVNGFNINGNIYGLGACTGVGKSWLTIQYLLPLVLHYKEPLVLIINEEDQTKIQREIEAWVINNVILKFHWVNKDTSQDEFSKLQMFNKRRFMDGHFTDLEKQWLKQASDWLTARKDEHLLTVVPLERYTVGKAIKIIKKYNKLGVRMFCLDTLKESADTRNVDTWKAMERDLVELYNVVKPSSLNVGLFITYQLNKQAVKLRYLTNSEVGQARNIMDVISVNLMVRKPFVDEFAGGRHEIIVTKQVNKARMESKLDTNENYMITFITKNRQGECDPYQIISRIHQGYNYIEELGWAYVSQDFA